jgi:hypothetical protein
MRPKTGTVALILLMLTIASCANVGRFGQIMNPEMLDKDELKKLPTETTPEYGFRVGMEINVPGHEDEILENVDHQFTEFSECFNITDRGEEARRYTIAVVNGTFRCEYHHWRCNGEYDSDYGLIIVSYKAFNRRGMLPVLKHEWAHVYGILRDDHKNLKEVRECTGY